MEDERRPAPVVTVRDPSRPDRPADVLVAGKEPEPLDPALSRRRLRVAGGLLLGIALLAGGLELRERRALAAEERRLDAVVDLQLLDERESSMRHEIAAGIVHLQEDVPVRNDGPRELIVLGAAAGGFSLQADEVVLGAGESGVLPLARTVRCAELAAVPPLSWPPSVTLTLDLRTRAGERSTELPLPVPVSSEHAWRVCGLTPLEQDVNLVVTGTFAEPSSVLVPFDVLVDSGRPVTITSLEADPGLRAELLLSDGTPADLPYELPWSNGGFVATSVQMRVSVRSCADAVDALAGLQLGVQDGSRSALIAASYEPGPLSELLMSFCSD